MIKFSIARHFSCDCGCRSRYKWLKSFRKKKIFSKALYLTSQTFVIFDWSTCWTELNCTRTSS